MNPFRDVKCHPCLPDSGDNQVTNDLYRRIHRSMQAADLRFWVELRGFEPLTPSMRTRCATGLRYSPRNGSQRSKPSGLLARQPRAGRAGQSPMARACASVYWS